MILLRWFLVRKLHAAMSPTTPGTPAKNSPLSRRKLPRQANTDRSHAQLHIDCKGLRAQRSGPHFASQRWQTARRNLLTRARPRNAFAEPMWLDASMPHAGTHSSFLVDAPTRWCTRKICLPYTCSLASPMPLLHSPSFRMVLEGNLDLNKLHTTWVK